MGVLEELMARRAVANAAVLELSGVKDDPRAPEALEHYRAQLAEIDAEIAKITGKPPDVIVGLKAATITGKA